MISFLRKGLGSWILLGILGLVMAAFIITGVKDPFGGARSARGAVVAKVAGKPIGADSLQEELQNRLRTVQQERPDVTIEQVVEAGGVKTVLDGLIGRLALERMMKDIGISGGKTSIDKIIAKNEAFHVGGSFNRKYYVEQLRRQRLTPAEYEGQLAQDVAGAQLLGALSRGWVLPDSVLLTYASQLEEKRTLHIIAVPASSMGEAPVPDDKAVAAYYEKTKTRYRAPELRSFRYLRVDSNALLPKVAVTDADIAAYVKDHAKALGKAETRDLLRVTLDTRDKAAAFASKAASGDFLALAKTQDPSLKDEDIKLNGQSLDEFTADAGDSNAKAVFALKAGGVSAPLETAFGWQVVKVVKISAASGATIDATTRAKATEAIRQEKSVNALYDLTEKLDAALEKRLSFDGAAKLAMIAPVAVPSVSSKGTGIDGQPVPEAQQLGQILQLAFNHRPGDSLLLEQIGDNAYALVEVTKVQPAAVRPLAEIKPVVQRLWQLDQLNERARTRGQAVIAALKGGKSVEAASGGLPNKLLPALTRANLAEARQEIPPAMKAAFLARPGETVMAPALSGNGFELIHVVKIEPGQASRNSASYQLLASSVARTAGAEASGQFVTAARTLAGVSIDQASVEQLKRRMLGKE